MQVSGNSTRNNASGADRHLMTDLIIVLRDGQVAEQGTHNDLLAIEGGVYQNLWNAQLQDNVTPNGGEKENAEEVPVVQATR